MKEYKSKQITIKDGTLITGYEGEYILSFIEKSDSYYEGDILKKWIDDLGNVETIFDIGANIGNHTLYFATHTEAKHIYSFEPYNANFTLLVENIERNKLADRVSAYNMAMGEKQGKVSLQSIDEENLGTATFQYVDDSQDGIDTIDLDSFIKEHRINSLDFIKIDTEGFECSILEGMTHVIEQYKPTLWIEVNADSFKTIHPVLISKGYFVSDMKGCNILYKNKQKFPNESRLDINAIVENLLVYFEKANVYYRNYEKAKTWIDNKNMVIESKSKEVQQIQQMQVSLQQELLEKQNKINELLEEKATLDRRNLKNEDKAKRNDAINKDLMAETVKLNQEILNLRNEKEEMKERLNALKNLKDSVVLEKDEKIEYLNRQRDKFLQKWEQEELANKFSEENIAALNKAIEAQSETIETLKEKNAEMQCNSDAVQLALEQNRLEKEDLENRCNDLNESVTEHRNTIDRLSKERDKNKKDIQAVAQKLVKEQKKSEQLNGLLYQSNRDKQLYEKLAEVKLYNFLRGLKHKQNSRQQETGSSPVEETKAANQNVSHSTNSKPKQTLKNVLKISEFKGIYDQFDNQEMMFELSSDIQELKDIKVACIMDEFTYECFSHECNLFKVSPDHWKKELEEFVPDLLFVESAWQGNDGMWARMIDRTEKPFVDLTQYCHEQGIPVAFWNKEDPVWHKEFLAAAGLCDYVFTTEIDSIADYKKTLEHDRVYLFHFAAQPKTHNPIETFERKDKFQFAGAYYHNYPKRSEAFDNLAHYAMRKKGLDIFDRNYKAARPEHAFPGYYDPFILGRLEPDEIEKAYKGYAFGINMNSVTQSQTMFARRVFELMASNSVVTGNFSRGQKNLFGNLTISTDNVKQFSKELEQHCSDTAQMHNYRLQGFRKVSQQHLYEDRLNYMIEKIFHKTLKKDFPKITVISTVKTSKELELVKEAFFRQNYNNKYLVLKAEFPIEISNTQIEIISENTTLEEFVKNSLNNGYIAYFESCDWYGENYLTDLALLLRYDRYDAIGKACYYTNFDGQIVLNQDECVYQNVQELSLSRAIVSCDVIDQIDLKKDFICAEQGLDLISADEFNYCKNYTEEKCKEVSDYCVLDQGIEYDKLEVMAENIHPNLSKQYRIEMKDLFDKDEYIFDKNGKLTKTEEGFLVSSNLDHNTHKYIYSNRFVEVDEEFTTDFYMILNGEPTMDIILACVCYDKNQERIGDVYAAVGLSKKAAFPKGTKYIKFAIRVKGAGNSAIRNIKIDDSPVDESNCFISRSNVLVLTNIYPSYDDLYRNMFVHSRVSNYKKQGYQYDVMRYQYNVPDGYREFEGVNVTEGYSAKLEDILQYGQIDTVCIHFLDQGMWDVLRKFQDKIRIIIWCHGSEIQPWWRRKFNYDTEEELNKQKELSEERMTLWNEVFKTAQNENIHFVFVSNYFKEEVETDYAMQLSNDQYSIIHNLIDTDTFVYETKNENQRKKVLSIRPFGSRKYANDLSAQCILELSKKEFFNDMEFHIIGRGVLFDEITEPLMQFDNVIIENKFLQQDEIAALHKKYGVFLSPTRMDSQGVSRDEAMSSGLVPVTNAVTAIPEFVDEKCGILAPGDDYLAMAEGIEKLYYDPELFCRMSRNAAERVRNQSDVSSVITKELELIGNE